MYGFYLGVKCTEEGDCDYHDIYPQNRSSLPLDLTVAHFTLKLEGARVSLMQGVFNVSRTNEQCSLGTEFKMFNRRYISFQLRCHHRLYTCAV